VHLENLGSDCMSCSCPGVAPGPEITTIDFWASILRCGAVAMFQQGACCNGFLRMSGRRDRPPSGRHNARDRDQESNMNNVSAPSSRPQSARATPRAQAEPNQRSTNRPTSAHINSRNDRPSRSNHLNNQTSSEQYERFQSPHETVVLLNLSL
jgi:hypothetical protein